MQNLSFHTSKTDNFSGFSTPLDESRYVVVGVPYDHTSTYRAGSRFGPHAIRDASLNIETYSLRTGVDIERVPIHDAGDLHIVDNAEETLSRLESVTRDILTVKEGSRNNWWRTHHHSSSGSMPSRTSWRGEFRCPR